MGDNSNRSSSLKQPLISPEAAEEILISPVETDAIDEVFNILKAVSNPECQILHVPSIINSLFVSDDEKTLIGGSKSGEVMVWDLSDREKPSLNRKMGHSSINAVLLNKKNVIYAGDEEGKLLMWDFSNNESKEFRQPKYGITALCFLSNNFLIAASKNGCFEVWNDSFALTHSASGHVDQINCLKISKNELNIYTASSDFTIKVWDEDYEEVRELPEYHKSAVVVLELFENLLVSGDDTGAIIVWNLEDFEVIYQNDLKFGFRCVARSSDNKYLYTVIENPEEIQVKIWDIENLTGDEPFAIEMAHVGMVNCLFCMQGSGKLVTAGDEKTVKVWNFNQISNESAFLTVNNIESMMVSPEHVIYIKDSELKFLSHTGRLQKSMHAKPRVSKIALDYLNTYLAHDCSNNCIYVWHLALSSTPYASFPHPDSVTCMVFSPNQRLITGSSDRTIRIWNLILKKLEFQFIDTQAITDVKCMDEYIYAANSEGVITIWDYLKELCAVKKFEYKARVLSIGVSEKHILVAGGELGLLKIWRWKDQKYVRGERIGGIKAKELIGHKQPVFKVIVNQGKIFSASYDNTIKIWSIDLRMLYFSIDLKCKITDLWLSESADTLYFLNNYGISQLQSPLNSSQILVYPQKYSWMFLKYLQKLTQNKVKNFDKYWKDYTIFPHIVNLLFILIKANQPELLKSAIKSGAKFLQERHGESPLSAALTWKNNICADVILKSLSKMKLHKEHGILESLENCMNKIIYSNLSQLPKLFESLFPVTTNNLSLYGQMKKKAPMISESESKNIQEEDFIHVLGTKNEQIEFRRSICRFDFVMGSQESMVLLRAISHSNNADFFRTSLLKSILKYKWNKVYYLLLGEALVYGTMLFIVSFLTITAYNTIASIILFLLNLIMLAKECVQVFESPRKYVKDFWNYIDSMRIICTYVYLVYAWSSTNSIPLNQILTILYWIRAVTYFRIFDKTRYLIRMIIETFTDIIPFLLIFFTATFTFALLFYITTGSASFAETFIFAYQLNFNEFSGFLDGYFYSKSVIFWCIFFISSIMNPIILLNLLIAIMSDTYDRVQEDQVVADCKEMAGLIMQAEGMLFWRRKLSKQGYLQRCDYTKNLLTDSQEWMGKIRAIKKSISRLQVKVRNNDRKLEKMQSRVVFKIREMKGINEQISKRIGELEGSSGSNKSTSSFMI